MKEKILTFIIGTLVGAIIATTGFLIYNKIGVNNSNQPEMMKMDENGQMGGPQGENMEEPPEKPNGNNSEEPPAKPEENDSTTTLEETNSNARN